MIARSERSLLIAASLLALLVVAALVWSPRERTRNGDNGLDSAKRDALTAVGSAEATQEAGAATTPADGPSAQRAEQFADSEEPRLEVLCPDGPSLAIHVTAPDGTPVLGAKVRLYPQSLRGPRDLKALDPAAFRVGQAAVTEFTDESGDATFKHGVVPDTIVLVEADGYSYSYGTVTREETEVGRSDFRLGSTASIQARVVDGLTSKPIGGATVFASLAVTPEALESESRMLMFRALTARRAATDLAGRCELPLLDDQTSWSVWVYADGYPPRRTYPVHVAAFDQIIRVFDGASMHGRVIDEEGNGVPGAMVKGAVRGIFPTQDVCLERTRDDGTFSLEAVPTAPLYFFINKMGYAMESCELDAPRRDEPLEFVLRKQAPFSGIVVDDSGRPIAGARIDFIATERANSPGFFETYDDGTFDMPWIDSNHTYILELRAAGHTERRIAGFRPQAGLRLVMDRCGTLRGQIVTDTGEPIRSFQVGWVSARLPVGDEDRKREKMQWQTIAAADGSFELPGVDAGPVHLHVAANGYARPIAIRVDVPPGSPNEPVRVELTTARSIAGRVVRPDGQPIVGASVSWLLESSLGIPAGRETPTKCDTDNAGQFTLSGLPDHPFQLRVTDNVYPNAIYPELRVGDFPRDLVFGADSMIVGRLLTPWSSPESGAWITARPERSNTDSSTDVQADGTFRFGPIPAGVWILNVWDFWIGREASAQDCELSRRVDVGAGETVEVEFDLRSRSRIVGHVAGTLSADELGRVELQLYTGDDDGRRGSSAIARSGCESDGRFVFYAVAPGRYVVEAMRRCRGVGAVAEASVEVAGTEQTVEVRIELPTPSLSGRILDGDNRPVPADVAIIRERDGATLTVARTESNGSYTVAPPGSDRFHLRFSAAGFADQESDRFGPDDLPTEPLEHVLETEARIAIMVRDDDGAPIAEARIDVHDAAGEATGNGPSTWTGRTALDGRVDATRLPAGAYHVDASHAAYPPSRPATIDVEWGETGSLTLTLTRVGRALLLLTDANGKPRPDVAVTVTQFGDSGKSQVATTDVDGRVTFERLLSGTWQASADGVDAKTFEVTPGSETVLTLMESRR